MAGVVNIYALFSQLVAKVNTATMARVVPFPTFYDYGRYIEVTRNLMQKDSGITTKDKKYPLIWIVVPYDVTETIPGIDCEIKNMQIIIATVTKQASTTPERITDNFIPYLWPIYDELRKQIDNSGFFSDIDYENLHIRTDQPYWDGKDGTSAANFFGDYIDAIQLKNIRLKVTEQTCQKFSLISGLKAH